jgi:hypothetical protein
VFGWIARFPSTITSDCGCQFESALWDQLTRLLGIQRIHTTAYHPITNGRLHRQLKAALKTYPSAECWTESLPMVLLGIRTALKEDLHCTAAELVYGTTRCHLETSQDGPYKVLQREDKHFVVCRHDTVSLDRLKPAHSEHSSSCTETHVDSNLQPIHPQSSTPTCHASPTPPPRSGHRHHIFRTLFPSRSLGGQYCGTHPLLYHNYHFTCPPFTR